MIIASPKRLGFFTRLLDDASAGERYRLAAEQIVHAERNGFDTAWVAQHHFHEAEGGLPAPLVFLAHVAAQTSRIRLGTGIITLPLEEPVRVAEDAAVFDLLSGGRFEAGVGSGGTAGSFEAFGHDPKDRGLLYDRNVEIVRKAWAGEELPGGNRLYPAAPQLLDRIWQATFSIGGGIRAGKAGDGLMLSRTQPRDKDKPQGSISELQIPIVEAYLAHLPPGRKPRIMGSRTLFVADDREEALKFAEKGLKRMLEHHAAAGIPSVGGSLADWIAAFDVHVGTPADVIASLRADRTLDYVTDLVFQAHSVDPPPPYILRSIELIASEVAPALGWQRQDQIRLAVAG
ncbi:MAG TPA: putative FMN-dependent luciferase-like monooxygenase [Devosiaceae bacterium]|nr:putative FMN-dependent luciferase-like monooxygenase [Devosiaceae bacterium]